MNNKLISCLTCFFVDGIHVWLSYVVTLSIHLSIHSSIHLSIHLSIYPFIHPLLFYLILSYHILFSSLLFNPSYHILFSSVRLAAAYRGRIGRKKADTERRKVMHWWMNRSVTLLSLIWRTILDLSSLTTTAFSTNF